MNPEKKSLILFNYSKPNTYSYAGLIGALDLNPNIEKRFEFIIVKENLLKFFENEKNWNDYTEYNRIILLFSLFSEQFPQFKRDVRKIRSLIESNLKTPIVVIAGGPHSSARPYDALKVGVDIAVQGEGEYNLPRILNEIHEKGSLNTSFMDIKGKGGILFKHNDKIILKESLERLDLNTCPSISFKHRLFGPIEISRGCPFNCKFCQYGNFFTEMKHKSVNTIVETIKKAVEVKYDKVWLLSPNSFAYGSENLIPNPKKIEELLYQLSQIENLKEIYFGTFPSEVRPDFVNQEVLDACKPYIANRYFTIGAQSASNRLLDYCNRGHTFEDVLEAVDLLKENGFESHLDFIFGLPTENSEDIEHNLEFFKFVLKNDHIKIHTHAFMPLPGSKFEKETPGVVSKDLLKIIGHLVREKKAYGKHQNQENVGKLIENL